MYATSSAPHWLTFMVEPQPVSDRSADDTAAPLMIVPPMVEGPGIDPSTPTTTALFMVAATRSSTRKKVSWFTGDDSVNIWLRSLQDDGSSTFNPVPYFVFAQAGTS